MKRADNELQQFDNQRLGPIALQRAAGAALLGGHFVRSERTTIYFNNAAMNAATYRQKTAANIFLGAFLK